eukprot:CAMPEP_0195085412 /NCGR_PEP_ID=MMETSP0448-20130528/25838_1 /TAXON_ID=66468 /ORGANISM="Heterocapsa triquestra, Strain CCMP 448" /LENGTH=266 /DNA_ID=CAMNT_0040118811 /DNA_START=36 /DNA_END=832 /DNA_ORIENTATION=+
MRNSSSVMSGPLGTRYSAGGGGGSMPSSCVACSCRGEELAGPTAPRLLNHAALDDADGHCRPPRPGAQLAHLTHHPHAFDHGAKDHMVPVVLLPRRECDHELGAVRVLAPVAHGEVSIPEKFHVKVLVGEGLTKDANAVRLAGALKHIATDDRRTRLDQVEERVLVADSLVPNLVALAQLEEVLARQRHGLTIEAHQYPALVLVAEGDVHKDLVSNQLLVGFHLLLGLEPLISEVRRDAADQAKRGPSHPPIAPLVDFEAFEGHPP